MDDWERFEENCLPPIEAFYSKHNLVGISESDLRPCSESLGCIWNEGSGRLSQSLPEDGCAAVEQCL